jgi:hypothetical protein
MAKICPQHHDGPHLISATRLIPLLTPFAFFKYSTPHIYTPQEKMSRQKFKTGPETQPPAILLNKPAANLHLKA